MNKLLLLILLTISQIGFAQVTPDTVLAGTNEVNPWDVKPSKESQDYGMYRLATFDPPYGLKKVKVAIAKIKVDAEDNAKVPKKTWDSWTTKEKFTYCMIHGESYSQNCDATPPIEDEHKKIFGFIPDSHMEADLSDRQLNFLKKNKDSVIAWIRQLSVSKKRVYLNFKEVILALNDKQAIPFLVDIYKANRKDHDILTTLILLMKEGKYETFLKSQSYAKLYGENSDWLASLVANKANQDLIMERAMNFYNGK